MNVLNSPFLVRAIRVTKEEFTFSSNIHFDVIAPGKLSTIIGKNDGKELEKVFVRLVKSVLNIMRCLVTARAVLFSSSLAKIKLQKERLKVTRILPPILPITVSISSHESS